MKADFGLRESDVLTICSILAQYPEVAQALIFGSRAKGSYHPGSDVDIALKGDRITAQIILRISFALNEETNMPYMFDVLNYHSIREAALSNHIDRVGIVIYERSNMVNK